MNKQKTFDLILDYLITRREHQEKLFNNPTLILVYGEPNPVLLYHDESETIICNAKESSTGLLPTSNFWNAIKFLWRNRKKEYNYPIVTTWEEVYDKSSFFKPSDRKVREYDSDLIRELLDEEENKI